jgi:uncharacterized protein (TIRG00374 family)
LKGKRILQIVISVILLGVLIYWVDVAAVVEAIRGASLPLIAVALLIITVNRVLMAVKWNVLLRARGVDLTWGGAVRVYYRSTFLGIFLPPTLGGDVVRAWLVTRERPRLEIVVSSILVERVLGLLALAAFGIAAAILFPHMAGGSSKLDAGRLITVVGGAGAIAVAAFAFSFTSVCEAMISAVTGRLADKRIIGKLAAMLGRIYASYREYRSDRGTLAMFFALTLLENGFPIVRAWVVAAALGVDVSLGWFLVIVPLELMLIRIPLSFDGFGIREGLFVYFLGMVGVDQGTAFAIGLVNHVLFLVGTLPGAFLHADSGLQRAGARLGP